MSRRATKKLLRKASIATQEERWHDAEVLYGELLSAFGENAPSLLDYAGCTFGLIRTLYALNRDIEAINLAEDVCRQLSDKDEVLVQAA